MGCGNSTQAPPDGAAEDTTRVAQLAKANIPTWKDVAIAQIDIKEVSGLGGSKTYKVSTSLDSVAPAAVAFHSLDTSNKALLVERNNAASNAFSKAGIGPALLAEDEHNTWCIHEWGGEAMSAKFTGPGCANEAKGVAKIESMAVWSDPGEFRERVGELLGKLHGAPTDWADPFVGKRPFLIGGKYPTMGFMGQKSLQTGELDLPPLMLDRYTRALDNLKPLTALAQKTVNLHADFHGANILIHVGTNEAGAGPPRAVAIDFEFTNIGTAAFDLGYAFMVNKALLNSPANKRAFVKGYVDAVTAGASSAQDVENLLVDCELATLLAWPPSEFINVPDTDADTYEVLVKRLAEFCSRAQVASDPEKQPEADSLRQQLLEKGAYALIREWHQS